MSNTEDAVAGIGRALGRIPSGIYILTATFEGHVETMLASWLQQAGFKPPAISVALGRDRAMSRMMNDSRVFGVTIMSAEDKGLMKRFARPPAGDNPLEGVALVDRPGRVPMLADGLAWMECELIGMHDFGGDHELAIGRVVAGDLLRQGQAYTHQRKTGFQY
jgi:flavin reductase (DIM6/NTAB) family NADH-FMN oxidoreductase RutF